MSSDFVIVGGGSAGCVLAARLSEDPAVSVTLVEAGGLPNDPAIARPEMWPLLQGGANDWCYVTEVQAHTAGRAHPWPRGRVLGGSSCLNAMAHVRGHRSDFDHWRDAGCTGWGYADLMPYFVRSESSPFAPSPYHGGQGPLRLLTPDRPHPLSNCFMAAAQAQGIAPIAEHNGARMCGPTLNTLTIHDGLRQSVADSYLGAAVARPNLNVLHDCLVTGLCFDRGRRCTGVEYRHRGQQRKLAAANVVLCAGTVATPAMLLRAGIGAAAELEQLGIDVRVDLPGVGRNLHDHLLAAGNVYRASREVPPSHYQHSESLLYWPAATPDTAPELVIACVVVPVVSEAFAAPAPGSAYTLMSGFTHPRSRGTLRLASADIDRAPRIEPAYLSESIDRQRFLEALQRARQLGAEPAFDDWRQCELLPGAEVVTPAALQDFLARAAFTHHHPVGTCAMGVGEEAVVDPALRVRGCQGLTIVDASVISRITSGPVNAAVIAIAERASDLLAGASPLAPFDPAQSP